MKHALLFLLSLLALPVLAQRLPPKVSYSCTENVSQQQHLADSLLQALDKSQIPTHILYDRVKQRAGRPEQRLSSKTF